MNAVKTGLPRHITIIGGGKGGVGKSTVSVSLIDYYQQRDEPVTVIDMDMANQDVLRAFSGSGLPVHALDMTKADGWSEFSDLCLAASDRQVVVNTKGSNSIEVIEFGPVFNEVVSELPTARCLFVIERSIDSALHLRKFVDAMPALPIHVLKNLRFGEDQEFTNFDGSTVKKQVVAAGGKVACFPRAYDRITEGYRTRRLSLAAVAAAGTTFDRAMVSKWRRDVARVFDELGGTVATAP